MKKYLAALVVVMGMAFVVGRQDQYGTDQSAHKTTESRKAVTSDSPNEQYPQEDITTPKGDGPHWYTFFFYSLFRWPAGTTTWAIILTLLAIAEQARETRRSVDVATKTLVADFRPKVVIRSIKLDPPSVVA